MNGVLLSRYDAAAVDRLLDEAGIYAVLHAKGFCDFEVTIDAEDHGMPHTRLLAGKGGERFLLLDTCVTQLRLAAAFFRERGYAIERTLDLVSLFWLREEDPTLAFTADRPRLPLQHHPGLGIIRSAFQVIVRMAREQGKDGIACTPKFFHDAVIFFHSRLFLFLDGTQQGRFEALRRDLNPLSLGTASMLLAVDGVRDADRRLVRWEFSPQVLPLSEVLCAYFNSAHYAEAVRIGFASSRFVWEDDALTRARQLAHGTAV